MDVSDDESGAPTDTRGRSIGFRTALGLPVATSREAGGVFTAPGWRLGRISDQTALAYQAPSPSQMIRPVRSFIRQQRLDSFSALTTP
jgi:hypothetical protein